MSGSLTWELSSHTGVPDGHTSCSSPWPTACAVHRVGCGLCCDAFLSSEANSLLPCGLRFLVSESGPCCLSLVLGLSSSWSLHHGCCLSVCLSVHVIYNLDHKLCTSQEAVSHYMGVPESISPAEGRLVCCVFEL